MGGYRYNKYNLIDKLLDLAKLILYIYIYSMFGYMEYFTYKFIFRFLVNQRMIYR